MLLKRQAKLSLRPHLLETNRGIGEMGENALRVLCFLKNVRKRGVSDSRDD